jgi:hypothetical protein
METEELNDVVQEATEQPTDQVAEQVESQAPETPQEDLQAKNIREMRLRKEQAEKERDEAYALLQKMKQEQAPEPPAPVEEDDYDLGVSENDLVEGKHLSKVAKEIKKLKKELHSYKEAATSISVETRIKQKYNDFDTVVSKENVDALVRDYPELGNTLKSSTDLYSQAVSAYTMIKQMGIYKEDKFSTDRAKAEENAAKPRPLASVSPQQGDSPLTRANAFANGLTEELKAQLRKEMEDARSRI